jgi:hypothetical protein
VAKTKKEDQPMLMRPAGALRILSADVLAAAVLTLLTLAAASAATLTVAAPGTPVTAVAGDGDRGQPPLPGPTDPNGP